MYDRECTFHSQSTLLLHCWLNNTYPHMIPNHGELFPGGNRRAQLLLEMSAGHTMGMLSNLVMLSHDMVPHLVPYHGEPCP